MPSCTWTATGTREFKVCLDLLYRPGQSRRRHPNRRLRPLGGSTQSGRRVSPGGSPHLRAAALSGLHGPPTCQSLRGLISSRVEPAREKLTGSRQRRRPMTTWPAQNRPPCAAVAPGSADRRGPAGAGRFPGVHRFGASNVAREHDTRRTVDRACRIFADHRRRAAAHRLLQDQRQTFANARKHQQVGGLIQRHEPRAPAVIEDVDVRRVPSSRTQRTPAGKQPRHIEHSLRQRLQDVQPLLLHESADEQEDRA